MCHMADTAQESRTEPVGAKVTPSEKSAIEAVRDKTGRSVSDLMREYPIAELVQWGHRIAASKQDPVNA